MCLRTLRLSRIFLLVLLGFLGLCSNVIGASTTVWQIGTFDESSREFASGASPTRGGPLDYSNPADDPVYFVGKSEPGKNWLAFQPGTSNGKAGRRAHPFTVRFDLSGAPRGVYTFTAALLAYSPRVPRLEVNINGHRGWFYQHPKLNYAAGDLGSVFTPRYSTATITCQLPARFLKAGENQMVLTAIDEPDLRDDSEGPPMVVGNSGIYYDALKLDQDLSARYQPAQVTAEALPTIFYKPKDGGLVEIIEVDVRLGEQPKRGRVTLALGKEKLTQELPNDREFGEQRVDFEVPELSAETSGEVRVEWNGRSRRFPQKFAPGKKWNVFVVPHEHVDIGFSDYQGKVAEVQSRAIDEAMTIARKEPDFRFSIDGYWSVEQFLANRGEQDRQQFFDLVRQGRIFVPPQYASELTGLPTAESLIRSLYGGFHFNRQHGGGFDYANITDVPSETGSYPSILAAAGLKYFLQAIDSYRGPVIMLGRLNEKSPWWWEGPDGQKILTWSSLSYTQSRFMFGLPPKIPAIRDSLPVFLQSYSRPDYKSDGVLVFGTQWENTDLNPNQMGDFPEWNKLYAYPKIHISGVAEAMEYIARQMGDSIPVMHGDGPYWEDGAISDTIYTALARQNEYRALSAEKFSSISALVNPRLQPEHNVLSELWKNLLLFSEHTWEADRGISDPQSQTSVRQRDVKDARATEASRLVDHLLQRSTSALADFIPDPIGTLIVFNSLNWSRTSRVEIDLDKGLEIVDFSSRQAVPYEVLSTGKACRRVRFLASDVPALGYKCYQLRSASSEPPEPVNIATSSLENRYYRLEFDAASGAIRSIFDKELNRELVDATSPYRFNQYVYVTGADEAPNRLIDYSNITPVPKLTPHLAGGGKIRSLVKLPFAAIAWLESSSVNTPLIESEVILPDGQKRIEIINHVRKEKVYTKEGVYFAFPFAMDHPQFQYAIQNGYIDPAKDILPGGCREWFTVQQWVAAQQGGVAAAIVPVDAPLVSLGDVVRGTWPTEFGERRGTIFSYLMNNYWDVNFVAGQGGDFTFRYVVTSGSALEPAALTRLGWEALTPLETDEIKSQDKAVNAPGPLDPAKGGFLNVDQPGVVLLAWKEAEDRNGYIMRFLEIAGQPATVNVNAPLLDVQSAWLCNAMEENQRPVAVSGRGFSFAVKPHEIVTVRVQGKPALAAAR
jgi:alpha-mannosidase